MLLLAYQKFTVFCLMSVQLGIVTMTTAASMFLSYFLVQYIHVDLYIFIVFFFYLGTCCTVRQSNPHPEMFYFNNGSFSQMGVTTIIIL